MVSSSQAQFSGCIDADLITLLGFSQFLIVRSIHGIISETFIVIIEIIIIFFIRFIVAAQITGC